MAHFDNRVRELMLKPRVIQKHILRIPRAAHSVRELSLGVPSFRVECYALHVPKAVIALPSLWLVIRKTLNDLLPTLPNLAKLRLNAIVIPRDQFSTLTFETVLYRSQCSIKIPNHVKDVHVEEAYHHDLVSAEARKITNTDRHIISWVLAQMDLQSIESLHVQNFDLTASSARFTRYGQTLIEIRLDLSWLTPKPNFRYMRPLLEELQKLSSLRIVDLRLPYHNSTGFPGALLAMIPQVRTLRVPLLWFPEFLKISSPATHINFELLYDRDQAVQDFDALTKPTWQNFASGKARRAQAIIQDMDKVRTAVKLLGEFFEQQRQDGVLEKRSLTLICCIWAMDGFGKAWCDSERWTTRVLERVLEEVVGFGAYVKSVKQES